MRIPELAEVETTYSRHIQHNLDRSATNGKAPETTRPKSPADHTPGPAKRTAKILSVLTDAENHLAALIGGFHITVAANPKPMIQ